MVATHKLRKSRRTRVLTRVKSTVFISLLALVVACWIYSYFYRTHINFYGFDCWLCITLKQGTVRADLARHPWKVWEPEYEQRWLTIFLPFPVPIPPSPSPDNQLLNDTYDQKVELLGFLFSKASPEWIYNVYRPDYIPTDEDPFITARRSVLPENYEVRIPFWAIFVGSCGLLVPHAMRWRKRREEQMREVDGKCVTCGYDLRSHALGENCPECGKLIAAQPATMDVSHRK